MNTKYLIGGVVALVLAGLLYIGLTHQKTTFGTAVNCQSVTCFTTVGVLTSFQDDGAAIFNGAVTFASTFVQSGLSTFTGGLKIGSAGTSLLNEVLTTCSMIANNTTATNTPGYAYCTGVTGVTSADSVAATFATSSTRIADGFIIAGAKASTTAGAIDFSIVNLSGAAGAPSAGSTIGSTTVISAGH